MGRSDFGRISVVGAELGGCGWALFFAMKGLDVTLYDREEAALRRAEAWIRDRSAVLEANGALPPGGAAGLFRRIAATTDLAACLAGAEYVQECMPETRDGKREILAAIERLAPVEAVVGSSCACYPISEIAPQTEHRGRYLAVYTLNPTYLVPLVEISGGPDTDPKVQEAVFAFFKELKKEPVILRKEQFGRVSSRVQAALDREMRQVVGEGVTTAADADLTVSLSSGIRYSVMGHTLIYDGGNGKGLAVFLQSTTNDTGKRTMDYTAKWTESPWPEDILVPADPEPFLDSLRRAELPPEAAGSREAAALWRDRLFIHQLQDHGLLPAYSLKEAPPVSLDRPESRSVAGFRKISVLGSGTIGAGWALFYAMNGLTVSLYDITRESLEWARGSVGTSCDTMIGCGILSEAGKAAILRRIRFTTDIEEALKDPDLIQECVPEKVQIKKGLVEQIERLAPAGALVGFSNSSMRISDMELTMADPGRYIVIHPFNPPHLIPFVELSKGPGTAPETAQRIRTLLESLNKKVVVLRKESFGHVGNRLKAVLERELTEAIGSGVVTLEDGNRIIACGPGFRYSAMGPILLADLETFGGIRDERERRRELGPELLGTTVSWSVTPYTPPQRTPEELAAFLKELRQHLLPPEAAETREDMCVWRDRLLIRQLEDHGLL